MKTVPNFFLCTLASSLAQGGSESEIYLSTITTFTGETLATADFATFGRGILTIDPLSSANVESASFTGIDGTNIGCTGLIRGLSAKDSTASTTRAKYHPVGTKVIIAFGAHNIEDVLTYVNTAIAGGLGTASDTTAGSVKLTENNPRAIAALVKASNPADMTLIVEPLNMAGFDQNILYAGGTTSAFVAPVSNPRIDLVVYSTTASALAVRTGTEAGSPSAPIPTAGDVVLCSVYHRVGETSIADRDAGSNGYIKSWYIPSIYDGAWLPGDIKSTSSYTVPTGWLRADGSAVSRSTYAALFSAVNPTIGTCTISIASPGVITKATHGLNIGDAIYFTTTGTLPTGLTANTLYYIITAGFGAGSFQVSATRGGSVVNTSNTQSGVHTLFYCPHGLGDGSTTFNVPNLKGRVIAGYDTTKTSFANLGYAYGEETHQLTVGELATHTHPAYGQTFVNPGGSGGNSGGYADGTLAATGSTGSNTAHNNVQPTLTLNFLVKV